MIKRVYAIFLRFFLPVTKSWVRIVQVLCWSSMDVLFWGLFSRFIATSANSTLNVPVLILSSVIYWNIFTRSSSNFSSAVIEDIRLRNLPNIMSSPISFYEYLIGVSAVSLANTVLSVGFMTLVAYVMFVFNIFQTGFLFIPFAIVLLLFGWSLGVIAVALFLRFGSTFDQVMIFFQALILPFSSIFYPLASMPLVMKKIAMLMPVSWIFEGMRNTLQYGTFALNDFFIALLGTVIFAAVALLFLLLTLRSVRRKGTITRFMTE